MKDLRSTYPEFHRKNRSAHVYPTEWVIRTLLGSYPRLALDKSRYPGARLLDLGFGDCRNMPLLANCGFDIYGTEISEDIVALGRETLAALGIPATLQVGWNAAIPFADGFFAYVLACHSCYYVDAGTSFDQNLRELARVLQPDGTLIASVPAPGNFILKDAKPHGDGHVTITNDVFGLRNGYVFRAFKDEHEVRRVFSCGFEDIRVCTTIDDFWGLQINAFFVVATRAARAA